MKSNFRRLTVVAEPVQQFLEGWLHADSCRTVVRWLSSCSCGETVSSDVVCTKGALLMTSISNIRSINCFPSLIWVSVSTLMMFIQQKVSKRDNKDLFIVTCDGGPIKPSKYIGGLLILVNQNHFTYSFFHSVFILWMTSMSPLLY